MSTLIVVAILVTACGGSPTSPMPSPTGAVISATPSSPPASATTIGQPADDGARIISVETIDPRTRDLTIESPAVGTVSVRLLVPTGFDDKPTSRWPVLYLLHGSMGSQVDWSQKTDVEKLTEPTALIVAMPDAGDQGWYSDWWNGGKGGQPMWETFHTLELPQLLERNWQASDKRAVAGLSMGGYGAMEYAARHPGMYAAAASYSGVLDPIGGGLEANDKWGDPVAQADIWQAHDPVNIADGLKGIDLYVSYGDGTAGPMDNGVVPDQDAEGWIHDRNVTFLARLDELKIRVTVDAYGPGTHTWPYWERALHRSLPLLLKAVGQ